ncbi:MAG TPA: hypothetical protein DDX29_11855 [Clostridiales bacterium]|nr:hypothetical protein [Clostridiales bacterium]
MQIMQNSLLFDGIAIQGTLKTPFHGGSEYAKYILREALIAGYTFDVVFRNDLIIDDEIISLLSTYSKCKIYYVNRLKDVSELIRRNNYKVFYSALPYKYGNVNFYDAVFIQVIHGLRKIELPWDFYKYKYKKNLMKILARIVSSNIFIQNILKKKHLRKINAIIQKPNSIIYTVSSHSKHSLLYFFPGLEYQNIKVFYSPFGSSVNKFKGNSLIEGDYYLMVNANRFEKNIYRAIKSFDKLISDGHLKDKKIVITGCNNLGFFKEIRNFEKFNLFPYVSTDEIESLYSNAFAFVYPSLNEGFGYPPLKAMGYGVPVIASCATSIPEVCSNAALYFNPLSMDELTNRILQIEYDKTIRSFLIDKGLIRFQELIDKQKTELPIMLRQIFGNV